MQLRSSLHSPSVFLTYREAPHLNGDHRFSTPLPPIPETSKFPSAVRSEQRIVLPQPNIWRSKRRTSVRCPCLIALHTRCVNLHLRALDAWLNDSRIGKCERKDTKMRQKHSQKPRTNHIQPSNHLYLILDYGEGLFWTQM